MTIGKLLAVIAAGAALAWGGAAAANLYNFTYTAAGPTPTTASGTFTTVADGGDAQLITAITGGKFNGEAMTLLPPGSCCSTPANDNLLFPNNDASGPGTSLLDVNGFAFSASGVNYNMFFDAVFGYSVITTEAFIAENGNFSISLVPEPMTWALMLLGVGALGVALRRRNAAGALA